ncbi:MAG: DUF695 domain-containing protein [Planctomycetota bacterium]
MSTADLYVYGTHVNDGQPAVILVDRALQPDPARPTLLMVKVPMREPMKDGSADAEEIDAFWEIAAALAERAGDAAVLAGMVAGDGVGLFCLYAADAPTSDERAWIDSAVCHSGARPYEIECQPDAAWDVFRGVLMPHASEAPDDNEHE